MLKLRSEKPIRKIDSQMLSTLYNYKDLYDEMKDKFELTLNLDPRYQLLAYIVASLSIYNGNKAYDIDEIVSYAEEYWPSLTKV